MLLRPHIHATSIFMMNVNVETTLVGMEYEMCEITPFNNSHPIAC